MSEGTGQATGALLKARTSISISAPSPRFAMSISMSAGEVLGVVGDNGAGKST